MSTRTAPTPRGAAVAAQLAAAGQRVNDEVSVWRALPRLVAGLPRVVAGALKDAPDNVRDLFGDDARLATRVRDFLGDTVKMPVGDLAIAAGEHHPLYPVTPYAAEVAPNLYRGSRLTEEGYRVLAQAGIKKVISFNAEGDADDELAPQFGLTAVSIPVRDNHPPTIGQVTRFLDEVKGGAYFHCQRGTGRTGSFAAAYRIAVQGWSAAEALAEAERFGMHVPEQKEFILALPSMLAASGRGLGFSAS